MSKFRCGVENGLFKVCFVLTCDCFFFAINSLVEIRGLFPFVFFKLVHVLTCDGLC